MEAERLCWWCEKTIPKLRWVAQANHHGIRFTVKFCTKKCMALYTADAKKYKTALTEV